MTRSELMSRIKSKNTAPERRLRGLLRSLRLGFRSQVRIAGYVRDFALPWCKVAVEVHGCFWHGHPTCYRVPKTNAGFWGAKARANMIRDRTSARAVRKAGWRNVALWECETDTEWSRKLWRAVAEQSFAAYLPSIYSRAARWELGRRLAR